MVTEKARRVEAVALITGDTNPAYDRAILLEAAN
jgi:hypothetical protein